MSVYLREYFASVLNQYKSRVSGWLLAIVAIGLNIASAYFVDDPSRSAMVVRWSARITAGLAILLILVAQYDAWKEERVKRGLEEAKNRRPEIRGRLFNFHVGIHGSSFDGENYSSGAELTFMVEVCNHRPIITNVKGLLLDGSKIDPSFTTDKAVLSGTPVKLEQGISYQFAGSCQVSMARPTPSTSGKWPEKTPVDLNGMVATLVDGFGQEHQLDVRGTAIF